MGERSDIVDLRVTNAGQARLVLSEVTLTGPAAGDFRVIPGSCGVPGFVASGSDCTMGIRFIPTTAGRRTARLLIRHNAPAAPPRQLPARADPSQLRIREPGVVERDAERSCFS